MKKTLANPLTDLDLQELYGILIDRDKDGALEFLDLNARPAFNKAMESG
jgi:hypothetical protein